MTSPAHTLLRTGLEKTVMSRGKPGARANENNAGRVN